MAVQPVTGSEDPLTVATPDKLARLRALHPDWAIWQVGAWWWASCGARWVRAHDLDELEALLSQQAEGAPGRGVITTGPRT